MRGERAQHRAHGGEGRLRHLLGRQPGIPTTWTSTSTPRARAALSAGSSPASNPRLAGPGRPGPGAAWRRARRTSAARGIGRVERAVGDAAQQRQRLHLQQGQPVPRSAWIAATAARSAADRLASSAARRTAIAEWVRSAGRRAANTVRITTTTRGRRAGPPRRGGAQQAQDEEGVDAA